MSERKERLASGGRSAVDELPPPLPSSVAGERRPEGEEPPPLPGERDAVALPPPLPARPVAKPAEPPPIPPRNWKPPLPPLPPLRIPEAHRRRPARLWIRWGAFTLPLLLGAGALVFWLQSPPKIASVPELAVAAPPPSTPASQGLLRLDAVPWAVVARIIDGDGQELTLPASPYTPLTIEVPPGRYVVELAHPELGEERRFCELEVSPSVPGECRIELFQIEPDEYLEKAGWWR